MIRYYESKADLTDNERKTYDSLIKDYDAEYTSTVKGYADRNADIAAGSDDAALLSLLSSQYTQMGGGSKAQMTTLNAEKENFRLDDKPIIGMNLNVFKLRT